MPVRRYLLTALAAAVAVPAAWIAWSSWSLRAQIDGRERAVIADAAIDLLDKLAKDLGHQSAAAE